MHVNPNDMAQQHCNRNLALTWCGDFNTAIPIISQFEETCVVTMRVIHHIGCRDTYLRRVKCVHCFMLDTFPWPKTESRAFDVQGCPQETERLAIEYLLTHIQMK